MIALWACLAAVLAGCGDERPSSVQNPPEPTGAPQRIICMAPSATETVFALGAGDRVVGVTTYTTWPEEALDLPRVGALYDPNLEKIVALRPDLVIVQQKHDRVEALCAERNIVVLRVHMKRLEDIYRGIRVIGEMLDVSDEAETLCTQIQADVDVVRRRVADLPELKTFVCVDRQPGTLKGMFTVGSESFLSDVVTIAGGKNIFDDVSRDYFQVSTEALIARAPEAIIETRPMQVLSGDAVAHLATDWTALPDLPAVRDGRVYVLTENYIVVPGPRVARIAERLAEVLHGDAGE